MLFIHVFLLFQEWRSNSVQCQTRKYLPRVAEDKRVTLLLPPSLFLSGFSLSHSVCLHPPFLSLPLSCPFLRRTHSSKLISREPWLIVRLQSPHAAAMVTGREYCCSERKFNTTFDDISRMRCKRMVPCVCLCVNVRVWLIYLTDLHPSQKAMDVRNTVLSLQAGAVYYMGVIASENEKYQQIQ